MTTGEDTTDVASNPLHIFEPGNSCVATDTRAHLPNLVNIARTKLGYERNPTLEVPL